MDSNPYAGQHGTAPPGTLNMKRIYFDIETGPLPESELLPMLPPFDASEVRVGNLKDEAKIAAKIAEAELNHRRDFIDRAALDATTGRVIAIGLLTLTPHPRPLSPSDAERVAATGREQIGEVEIIGDDDEAATLREFWKRWKWEDGRPVEFVGFNVLQFDLPFLVRRSWKLRVPVPAGLRRGRYWGDGILDLRDVWQLGDRQARGSLDAIARHLGIGGKNGDGKEFAKLWQSDRQKAVAYLKNDLELTARIAESLGCAAC